MISALNRLANGNLELTVTIPWAQVKTNYTKTLKRLAKNTEIKGFRKGKAPSKLVEQKLGKQAIYEEVLKALIPQVYLEAVKEQQIKPIINPQIKVISLTENKDWQFQAITCEWPKVELGNYQEEVRKALSAEKIWVPGKETKEPAEKEMDKKLSKMFGALLAQTKLDIPEVLLADEVNRMLSRLIDQTGQLGLTVEAYLSSIGKTSEQLKQEYHQQAGQTLRLEFILQAIADKEKIEVAQEEIEKMIKAVPEKQARENLKTPTQKAYLHQLLRKRKVIDKLMKL